jgi:hypothetical protein
MFCCVTGCVPDDPPGKPLSAGRPSPALPARPTPPAKPGALSPLQARLPALARPAPADDPPLTAPFTDRFERDAPGPDWNATVNTWHIESGRWCVDHAKNHPLWLKRRLPTNARIEFDAASYSEDGDLKAEFWGDGRSAADQASYNDATSYLAIFGGWKNSFHVLARIDEHAPDRPEIRIDDDSTDPKMRRVQASETYHFKVVRSDGRTVRWSIDDVEMLSYPDPAPLSGPGHDHFGFNDWDVRACFDNLVITPLP